MKRIATGLLTLLIIVAAASFAAANDASATSQTSDCGSPLEIIIDGIPGLWEPDCATATATPTSTASATDEPAPTATATTAPTATPEPDPAATATPQPTATATPASLQLEPACARYVSTAGSDSNTGSENDPWASLAHAAASAPEGCTVWFAPGVYSGEQRITRRATDPIVFRASVPYQARLEAMDSAINLDGAAGLTFVGFEITHSGDGAGALVVSIHSDGSTGVWAERITFRDNVIHDSYNNDLFKPYNGVDQLLVEGNVFYNPDSGEQWLDINGVSNSTFRNNIFFNDWSQRPRETDVENGIVIKDSGGAQDGVEGSYNVVFQRNILLNYGGELAGTTGPLLKLGGDGRSYYEATYVNVVDNYFVGNGDGVVRSWIGFLGVNRVAVTGNYVFGDQPAKAAYALLVDLKASDAPLNDNIEIAGNTFSDPTGTMGDFDKTDSATYRSIILDSNTYWNGGQAITGDVITPDTDANAVYADPGLNSNITILPTIERLLSGHTISSEYNRIISEITGS